MTKLG